MAFAFVDNTSFINSIIDLTKDWPIDIGFVGAPVTLIEGSPMEAETYRVENKANPGPLNKQIIDDLLKEIRKYNPEVRKVFFFSFNPTYAADRTPPTEISFRVGVLSEDTSKTIIKKMEELISLLKTKRGTL